METGTVVDMKLVSTILKLKHNGKVIGRNKLFKLLRQKKVLQEGNNLPYKKFLLEGYFEIKKIEVKKVGMYQKEVYKTLVTESGVEFIKNLLT